MGAKDPRLYLIHIRDCCARIQEYTAQSPHCRNLEIIGEAAGKLDEAFRQAHPEIPWRSLIGARNILIHAYDQVQPSLLLDIVDSDVPALQAAVARILQT